MINKCLIKTCDKDQTDFCRAQAGLCEDHSNEINNEFGYENVTNDIIDHFVNRYGIEVKPSNFGCHITTESYAWLDKNARLAGFENYKAIGISAVDQFMAVYVAFLFEENK